MRRPSPRSVIVWLLVAVAAGLALYKFEFAAISVVEHTIARGEIVAEVMGTGTLEARVKSTISARIQERLAEVLVDQGDPVVARQLVARLDDAESRQQVAIAEASLLAARKSSERVHADLARSEAVLAQARLASTRQTKLIASRATSQSDVDKGEEALRVAEADLKRAHAGIAEAAGQELVAGKNLLFRTEQLAHTEIHSPYDGLIIRRDRDPGDIVVPGASLMEIISLKELWVSAWVDETGMPDLAAGQTARVIFRAEPGRTYVGTVARLGRELDRETREFLVDVRVTELPKNWSIGQRADVFIETKRQSEAVLLPATFLSHKGSHAGVFVGVQGRAQWRDITVGLRSANQIAVTEGLKVGDQVLRVREGQKGSLAAGDRIAAP